MDNAFSIVEEKIMSGLCWNKLTNNRMQETKALEPYGYKVYSQNDEDGIIQEIFKRIGTTNEIFVEFGVQNGLESNGHYLLFQGWRGIWIEGSKEYCEQIQERFRPLIQSKQLSITPSFITRANINTLIGEHATGEIDLLCIDIDGNDYYIWEAIHVVNPRVVVIEYNGKFPPDCDWKMAYNKEHVWDGSDWHGASLKALETLGDKLGYYLVGTNYNGVNAFFVKKELVYNRFLEPYTAENLYNPLRDIRFTNKHPTRYCLVKQKKGLGLANYEQSNNNINNSVKFDVLIWGIGEWTQKLLGQLPQECNIVAYVQTVKTQEIFDDKPIIDLSDIISGTYQYDFVMVTTVYGNEIKQTLMKHGINLNKFYFCNNIDKKITYFDSEKIFIYQLEDLFQDKKNCYQQQNKLLKYSICNCSEVNYIVNNNYKLMVRYLMDQSYQCDDIQVFFELSQKYYGIDPNIDGVLVDIGANIGTTSIFAKKVINPNLKILAFEPRAENIKQFKINCILNDMEKDTKLVECALTDKRGQFDLVISEYNLGDNRLVYNLEDYENWAVEIVDGIGLDEWLNGNPLYESQIKYVWIDVQGFEGNVLKGGMEFFKRNCVPLYMEFWPSQLKKNNMLDVLIHILKECYSGFLCVPKYKAGDHEVKPISMLYELADEYSHNFCDIFLIK